MRLSLIFIILTVISWSFDARAQVPQEMSSSSMPEAWQLTLDVIKSKAQSLVIENNGLQIENHRLVEEARSLAQSIVDLKYRNDQISHLIKVRHGRTDQEMRVDELTQTIKMKSQQE